MSQRVVYFNGHIVPESEARLSIYDSALQMGDMAFEVTRTYRHQPFRLRDHLERLWHSLARIRTTPGMNMGELEEITKDVLVRNLPTEADDVDWNIIHNVSRGPGAGFSGAFTPEEMRPTVIVSCYPITGRMAALAPAYTSGIELVIPSQRAIPSALLEASIKTRSRLHYQLANFEAAEILPGSTAVLVDPDGYLTETTSGNIFIVVGGELLTPTRRNLLPGITRDTVLELAQRLDIPAREADVTPEMATMAEEMFVTSTSIGIIHARTLNRVPIGTGEPGLVTRQLREALQAEVGLDFAEQARGYARRLALS